MITVSSVPKWEGNIISRVVDDGMVLVLPDQAKVKVVNEVARRICELLDGVRTVGQIVAVICQEYQVEPAQAEKDALGFLQKLADSGVISYVERA